MRKIMQIAIALSAALSAPAFGQGFEGQWITTAHPQTGDVSETLTVRKAGEVYTVQAKLIGMPPGTPEAGPGKDVVVDGEHFSFRRALAPDSPVELEYAGVVMGDTFTGTVEIVGAGPGMKVSYTGVRQKGVG